MKKIAIILLATLLPMMASALAFTVNGLSYEHLGGLNDGVRLLGFVGDKCPSKITIPATVVNDGKTYSVEVISSGAFLGNTELTSVKMETQDKNGVKYIEPNSFAGCTNLSEVIFSGILEAILAPGYSGQMGAFEGCTALKSIDLPASMDYKGEIDATATHNICKWAFKNCSNLEKIIIRAQKPYIEDEAFLNCSSLQYFVSYNTQPWNLESNTFQGIPSSATLIVPDGTKSSYQGLSGWNAFNNVKEHSKVDLKAIIGEDNQSGGGTAKLTIEDFTIKAGETKTMLIDMQNPDDQVTLVQFDLRLPDGLSIVTGDDAIDIAGRTTWKKHTLTSNAIDGITRILLYSATNQVIEGTSGAIISIKLVASSSFNGGDIKLENQLMTTPSLVESKPAVYTYIIKGGGDNPPVGDAEPYVVFNNGTLTFYCDNQRDNRQGTKYELTGTPEWYVNAKNITNVVFDASFANARPTSTSEWFFSCENLTGIQGLGYLNTSEVTNMRYMFSGCEGLTSLDLSDFNTANVTNMAFMFNGCKSLTGLDLSNFNTANVTTMDSMFESCYSLTSLDLSNFNTANVTIMYCMFSFCGSLTSLDVSRFNTVNVISMGSMFNDCSSLTSLDVSSFNTTKVTGMSFMFNGCKSLTSLDVSNFNTNNVTGMSKMFNGCSKLTKLTLGNGFATTEELECTGVFANCSSLNTVAFTGDIPSSINSKFFAGVGTADSPALLSVPKQFVNNYAAKFDGNMFFGGYFKLGSDNTTDWKDGDVFTAKTIEGVEMTFKVISAANKTCQVGDGNNACIDTSTSGCLTIPAEVMGFKVTSVSSWALYRCQNLNEIAISEGIESLMSNCIEQCNGISSFDLPASVISLSTSFGGISSNLKSIKVAEGNPVYDSRDNCNAIIETATNILRNGCAGTVIPSSVTAIGDWSMSNKSLTSVSIPNSVTSIGVGALRYNSFKSVVIPESVEEIGSSAFSYSPNLEKVTILSKKCKLGHAAFGSCSKLKTVVSYIENPEAINGTIFYNKYDSSTKEYILNDDVVLYVPKGTKQIYEQTNGWKEFANIQEMEEESSSAYSVYHNGTLTFYCDDQRSSREGTIYSLNEGEAEPEWVLDDNNRNVEKVVFDASFAKARPTSTFQWFFYCDYLTEIKGIENLNTSEVKNMHTMFAFCKKLESVDVSHFDTRKVGDMGAMFSNCKSLKSIDLSHFDTSNLWMMMSMFIGCNNLTEINLSSFNTSKVEYLSYLFDGCSNLRTLYFGSGFTSTNSVSCEEVFVDCSNLSKVVFTGDIPASINSTFFDGVGSANAPVKLDVPEQYTANYEAKFDGNMFFGGYFTLKGSTGVYSIMSEDQPKDVYSLNGTLLRKNATSVKLLPKGIYLINGRKVVVR